jgi:hypothetical protein
VDKRTTYQFGSKSDYLRTSKEWSSIKIWRLYYIILYILIYITLCNVPIYFLFLQSIIKNIFL